MRAAAALVSAVSALWLLAVTDAWVPRIAALLGLAFAALWLHAIMRRRASAAQAPDSVEIGVHHLAVRLQGQGRTLPLTSVRRVEIDNDRLAIVVTLEEPNDTITLDSAFAGVGQQELAALIDAAARASRTDAQGKNAGTMSDHE